MTEFSDFLRHKVAYVAIGEFKSGKFAAAQDLYEKAIATYGEGFLRAYLLQKPGTDEGIAIIMWEGVEDMELNQNEAYKELIHQMTPLFAKPPVSSLYDICSEITPKDD